MKGLQKGVVMLWLTAILLCLAWLVPAWAKEMDEPALRITGSAEFRLKYARGDTAALTGTGYSLGSPDLTQLLTLDVEGQIAPGFTAAVNLDNRRDGNLQMVELRLEGEKVRGKYGGIGYKATNPYLAFSDRLRGLTISTLYPKANITLVAGRVQGVAAKKTFKGSSAQETIRYELDAPYGPSPTSQGFTASLDGMEYYILTDTFDPDFMAVSFRYEDQPTPEGRTLLETLELWNLDYLPLEAGQTLPLTAGQYVGVSLSGEFLALKMGSGDLIRSQIQALIRTYNLEHGLIGDEQKKYPFVVGSEAEKAFLQDLITRHVSITAGVEGETGYSVLDAKADSYLQRRLYHLGQSRIIPGSLDIKVRKGSTFVPVENELSLPFLVDYDQGIVDFQFPAHFFDLYSGMEITYQHELTMGSFNLGIGLVEGSERVLLNDVLLVKDKDYSLDYELGILTLWFPLNSEDVLVVEYEYFRGPFGRAADYKTNFYSTELDWAVNDNLQLNLGFAAQLDLPRSAQTPELVGTMPNQHLMAGLAGTYKLGGLTISGELGLSHNQFPRDDNAKGRAPNQISAIMQAQDELGREYVILAHNDGISVGSESFQNYQVASGLAHNSVRALASSDSLWFFATANGLTVLAAESGPGLGNPLDYAGNWTRFSTSSGLPSSDLSAVAVTPWQVWVGTSQDGLASAELSALDNWTPHLGQLPSQAVSALAYDPRADLVLVGTDRGIAAIRGEISTTELDAVPIRAISSSFSLLNGLNSFAAGPEGVYVRQKDGSWQSISGAPAGCLSVLLWENRLWVGTEAGLYNWDGNEWTFIAETNGFAITALGTARGYKSPGRQTLWAGTAGTVEEGINKIVCFELEDTKTVFQHGGKDLAVSPDDAHRYEDIPKAGHTAVGYAGRLNARYTGETVGVFGSYEKNSPDFMRLGRAERREGELWRLGTQWTPSSKLTVTAEHSRTASRPISSEDETVTITNRLGSTVIIGPQVDVTLVQTLTKNAHDVRRGRTFSLVGSQRLLDGRLDVSAGLERSEEASTNSPLNSFVQTSLRGDAKLTLDALSLTGSYRKPVKLVNERRSGISDTRFTAQWAKQLAGLDLRALYNNIYRHNLATDKTSSNQKAELKAVLPAINENRLIPNAVFVWEQTVPFTGQAKTTVSAQANITGSLERFRLSSGLLVKRTVYPELKKEVTQTELHTSVNPITASKLQPQFDLRWKRSVSERPDLGSVNTHSLTSSIRLSWNPSEKLRGTASAAYALNLTSAAKEVKKHTVTLQNSLFYRLSEKSSVTGTALTRLNTETGRSIAPEHSLKLQLTADFSYRFSETWSLTTSLSWHRQAALSTLEKPARAFTINAALKASF